MSDLKLSLVLKAVDQATAPIRRVNESIRALSRDTGLPRVVGAARNLGQALGASAREAARLSVGLTAAVGVAGFAFKRFFLDTAAEFERYEVMLRSLEGGNEAAARSMDWIGEFATRVPFELRDMMDAYVRLRTFGLDPTNGTLQALVDQAAKMGGSQETLKGIILATGQAWTKQKLQGEEALQLIERGVPVWDLLAKRTGLTAAQLQELSQKGRLGRGAIKLLIEEMGKSSSGAAAGMAKTWSGMVSMISDHWARFANKVMASGAFDFIKAKLQLLLDALDRLTASGRLTEIAEQLGRQIVTALENLWEIAKDVWAVMRGVGATLGWVRDLFGSWKPIVIALAAIVAGPFLLSLIAVLGAVKALAVAMASTPFGLIVAGIGAAALLVISNWETLKQWFVGFWDFVKTLFTTGIEWLKKIFEYSPIGLLLKGIDKLRGFAARAPASSAAGTSAATLAPGTARAEVAGRIHVQIDSTGRPRVRKMESSGEIDMEADVGTAFSGGY